MSAAEIITPDFRRRTVDGRRVHRIGAYAPPRPVGPVAAADLPAAPDARRASAHLTDDFGIPATDPALIADLLVALEAEPWRGPVIRTATGVDRRCRVHVAVGARTFLLDAADARLAASALDQEQAFSGCTRVAAVLRDAAQRADWARPYHRRDARGVRTLRQRLAAGGRLRVPADVLWTVGGLVAFIALLRLLP